MFYIFNTHLDTIVSKTHFLNGNHIGMANIACKNCIFCFVLKLKSNKILTLGKDDVKTGIFDSPVIVLQANWERYTSDRGEIRVYQ